MSQHAQTRYSLVLPPPTDAHHDCQRKNTQNSRNMTPRVAALARDGAHRRSREHAWERHRCGDERRRGGQPSGVLIVCHWGVMFTLTGEKGAANLERNLLPTFWAAS